MKTSQELQAELAATQAQLKDLKSQLATTKEAHNLFLHKISHDIKTPSNEILETFTQLELLNLNDPALSLFIAGKNACLQLDRLLEQLLTLDELQNQRARVNRSEFNLKRLIEMHVEQLKSLAIEQSKASLIDIELQWHYKSEQLCSVVGDKEKFNKIMSELLHNALEHTPKGKICISIDCLEEGPANIALDIKVIDSGDGMPQSQVDQIFTPFAHYADFFHGSFHKAGLSLILCQKLTHLMSGTLEIHSSQGQGTQVSLKMGFPVLRKSVYLRQEGGHSAVAARQTYIKNTDQPILIVDDNPVNRNILCAITRRLGFETQQASHGQEAIEMYKKHQFALIFMDCQMPVMNGFEATKILRNTYKSKTPIIAVTANSTDEDIHQCFSSGMDDFIPKPVSPHKIGEALSRWLTHQSHYQQKEL